MMGDKEKVHRGISSKIRNFVGLFAAEETLATLVDFEWLIPCVN